MKEEIINIKIDKIIDEIQEMILLDMIDEITAFSIIAIINRNFGREY